MLWSVARDLGLGVQEHVETMLGRNVDLVTALKDEPDGQHLAVALVHWTPVVAHDLPSTAIVDDEEPPRDGGV